jgi:hypothetical protein
LFSDRFVRVSGAFCIRFGRTVIWLYGLLYNTPANYIAILSLPTRHGAVNNRTGTQDFFSGQHDANCPALADFASRLRQG